VDDSGPYMLWPVIWERDSRCFPRHNGLQVASRSRRTTAELTCHKKGVYGAKQYTTEFVGLGPEKTAIIRFHEEHPLDGYRRLTFMMLDNDIVAVSPTSTWRVLHQAGLLRRWNSKPSKKGQGFHQPSRAHRHWHTDISYLNIGGTFYYL
jgi:hypothetical protein